MRKNPSRREAVLTARLDRQALRQRFQTSPEIAHTVLAAPRAVCGVTLFLSWLVMASGELT
jgi:hypothetical protein